MSGLAPRKNETRYRSDSPGPQIQLHVEVCPEIDQIIDASVDSVGWESRLKPIEIVSIMIMQLVS